VSLSQSQVVLRRSIEEPGRVWQGWQSTRGAAQSETRAKGRDVPDIGTTVGHILNGIVPCQHQVGIVLQEGPSRFFHVKARLGSGIGMARAKRFGGYSYSHSHAPQHVLCARDYGPVVLPLNETSDTGPESPFPPESGIEHYLTPASERGQSTSPSQQLARWGAQRRHYVVYWGRGTTNRLFPKTNYGCRSAVW